MPFNEDGVWVQRDREFRRRNFLEAMKALLGEGVDTTQGNPLVKLYDAGADLVATEVEDDLDENARQLLPNEAGLQVFRDRAEFHGFRQIAADRAVGKVQITLTEAVFSPDPLFEAGTLTFSTAGGEQFDLVADIAVSEDSSDTVLVAEVRAQELGGDGNIESGEIVNVDFVNAATETRWFDIVADDGSSFTNDKDFAGGRGDEDLAPFKGRVQDANAAREGGSPAGLVAGILEERVAGTNRATVIENKTLLPSTRDHLYDGSDDAGTQSDTLIGDGDKASQKTPVAKERFSAHFAAKLAVDNDLVCTVRLETDDGTGKPSGTLVDPLFVKTGFDFNGTDRTVGNFLAADFFGDYIETGDYHLVFVRESGSGRFDGAVDGGSPPDDPGFHVDTGCDWETDASIDNAAVELIGGVPPKGYRLVVEEGFIDSDLAKYIHKNGPLGIQDDGSVKTTIAADNGQSLVYRHEVPTRVPLVVNITLEHLASFEEDAAAVRQIIKDYVNGKTGVAGLGVGKAFIAEEAIARVLNKQNLTNTHDVTLFRVGKKSDTGDPADLTGSDETNEPVRLDEIAFIETPVSDIKVTLVEVS